MRVILQKNGVVLASDGPEYVVLFDGQEFYRGMHRGAAEEQVKRLAGDRPKYADLPDEEWAKIYEEDVRE